VVGFLCPALPRCGNPAVDMDHGRWRCAFKRLGIALRMG
jgi:hypothetical protein